MSEPLPRFEIPDAWAGKGQCPLCGAAGLQVRHVSGAPDRMTCVRCRAAFEVEPGGARIRLRDVPLPLFAPLVGAWLTMAEVTQQARSLVASAEKRSPPAPSPATDSPPATPPVSRELIAKIQELRALGNSPRQIQAILDRSVSSPEEMQAALAEMARLERVKRAREGRTLWLVGSSVAVAIVLMIGAAWIVGLRNTSSAVTGTPGTPLAPNLPPALLTLIPPGVTVLPAPTVFVQTAAPAPGGSSGPVACPTIAVGAAKLFGGEASNWSYDSQSLGWTFISTKPTTLNLPAGMYMGYVEFGASLSVTQVGGPATVGNVVFAAISCE